MSLLKSDAIFQKYGSNVSMMKWNHQLKISFFKQF